MNILTGKTIIEAMNDKPAEQQEADFQKLLKDLAAQKAARGGKVLGLRGADRFTNSNISGGGL